MTQEHPITPPLELIREWALNHDYTYANELWDYIATQAARWGADQELKACCKTFEDIWNNNEDLMTLSDHLRALRAYRRPNPPSLKKQALLLCNDHIDPEGIIRRALESIPDEQ